ncbi:MAG: prephenate dehydrogenase [Candidatus Omnitrophota bacterium]
MKKFKKVVIIGPGLIGGSIGLFLKKEKAAEVIVGVARHQKTLKKAKQKKMVDATSKDLINSVRGADLIIIATPVQSVPRIFQLIKNNLQPGCIIFDVGSTKKYILKAADKYLPRDIFFIGTHPMAGSEKAGPEFADRNLFRNSICFIVKPKKVNKKALIFVQSLWKKMGAKVILVKAEKHDQIVAGISHLPHLVSVAIVNSSDTASLKFAATGYKDTTRVVAGLPEIWEGIFFTNKNSILKSIMVFEKELFKLKKALKNSDKKFFTQQLTAAKKTRDKLK